MKTQTTDLLGQKVGHIRVVDVLGEGGMGAVYVGFDDTLQRKVALKAIRSEFRLSEEAKARFLREARILSQLDHPYVCTVHDFVEGEESDFLVMELVEGSSLRQAMKEGLEPAQKMGVARQLLEVLVAVHGEGVVHRDLKPENVMVMPTGVIKVLDFGLARSVEEEAAGVSFAPTLASGDLAVEMDSGATSSSSMGSRSVYVKTELGTVLGTAGYMSPEQARGEPATSASDMYSLGLTLQEMFTGEPPMEQGLAGRELLEKARQADTRPVVGLAPNLTALIERLKSPAPGARPSSVDALATLDRIIGKPARRRKRALVTAVWVVLALLAVGMTVQSIRASREAEAAKNALEETREVSQFLESLFEVSDPGEARGETVTARELLETGAQKIRTGFSDQPLARARFMQTIGNIYEKLGLYDLAEPLLAEALSIRREELPGNDPILASSFNDLGVLHFRQGRFEEAEPLFTRAIEIREEALGGDHASLGDSLNSLGVLRWRQGRYDEAQAALRRGLEIYERTVGVEHQNYAMGLDNLGNLFSSQGRFRDAEPLYQQALEINESTLGADHPDVARSLNLLAIICCRQGRLEDAEPLFRRALEIWERALGSDHPSVASSINNLGALYHQQGRYGDAEPFFQRAVELKEKALGPDHPAVASSLDNLAVLFTDLNRHEDAEPLYRRALQIREKVLGPDHPDLAGNLNNIGILYSDLGRHEEAEPLFTRALEIREKALGTHHSGFVWNLTDLGASFLEQGRLTEAEAVFARAITIAETLWTDDPSDTEALSSLSWSHVMIGRVLAASGDVPAARAQWTRVLELLRTVAPESADPYIRDSYAQALLLLGRVDDALPLVEGLLDMSWNDRWFLALCREHGLIDEEPNE